MSALKKSPHVDPNYSYLEVPRRWRSAPQLMDERLELLHRDPEFLYATPQVGEMSQRDKRCSKGSSGLRNKFTEKIHKGLVSVLVENALNSLSSSGRPRANEQLPTVPRQGSPDGPL